MVSGRSPPPTSGFALRFGRARAAGALIETASSVAMRGRHTNIGDQHFLVANPLELEPFLRETKLTEVEPVVAFAVEKDQRVAAVLIGLRYFHDAPLIRRRAYLDALSRERVRPSDSAANDVGLLRDGGAREPGRRENSGQQCAPWPSGLRAGVPSCLRRQSFLGRKPRLLNPEAVRPVTGEHEHDAALSESGERPANAGIALDEIHPWRSRRRTRALPASTAPTTSGGSTGFRPCRVSRHAGRIAGK